MKLTDKALQELQKQLEGEVQYDTLTKALYATDASVYRRIPNAVVFPKTKSDLQHILRFANTYQCGIIPRTAGTSLAGQCVGEGIIVDVSKYFNAIGKVDLKHKTVTVAPGVIRDDLNRYLAPYGLFFGPNTSTSNRCMIGGMVGNNSSGTTSIQYGVTRDKVIAMEVLLADGSTAFFKEITPSEFLDKCKSKTLEGGIYNTLYQEFNDREVQEKIQRQFPKPEIHRRNTGYAIDAIINTSVFSDATAPFNMCSLLTGSEGTLAFTTSITLQLDPLPPAEAVMIATHFHTIAACMDAVAPLMKHRLYTCEMMDKTILDCTKNNIEQRKNRFFLEGDPKAILMLELRADTQEELQQQLQALQDTLAEHTLSYANPLLYDLQIQQALELRKAGLGLLGNIVGDKKAVACIEDTAVSLSDLSDYIAEFTEIMESYDQEAVYYAHAGAGELHLRPILDLKQETDVRLFTQITDDVARLVKKYNGSMSGEHGDGIVRSSYIPFMIGEENYKLLKKIKQSFDPNGIFNPGKIIDPFPMDQRLRYETGQPTPEIDTFMDFSDAMGILRAVEKCNGSGDCRKSVAAGGTMCPSYRVTRDEKDTTRGRANTLREFLTKDSKPNAFDHEELKEVFDLCLSCKGCASECPSNVDIAAVKAEFQYQYQQQHGVSLRTKLFAYTTTINRIGSIFPRLSNFVFSNRITSRVLKSISGVAQERSLPLLSRVSLRKWCAMHLASLQPKVPKKEVYFFIDEFTEYLDTDIGIDAIKVLTSLQYKVKVILHKDSGRSFISKGLLNKSKIAADANIDIFYPLLSDSKPLLGIEPSAILTFKDEYIRLASNQEHALAVSKHVYLIDEFLAQEIENGNISSSQFKAVKRNIKLHGHCHQKALSNIQDTFKMLNIIPEYTVTIIPSGCCGMAGSFGYEKEHYELSMKVGAQTLFPAIQNAKPDTLIAATGTSCRHQIADGTGRKALHPISILKEALL